MVILIDTIDQEHVAADQQRVRRQRQWHRFEVVN